MIIANISSGLGNQLFQFASAKALALRNYDILKLDITYFHEFKDRNFELYNFNITDEIATLNDINSLKGEYNYDIIKSIKHKFSNIGIDFYNQYHVKEKPFFSYEKKVISLKGDIYLEGYWQNEKYFKDFANQIRLYLTLNILMDKYYEDIYKLIKSVDSISIHIRRGDYLHNKIFSNCSLKYYLDAFSYISARISCPVFFVFSDDIEWAKEYLPSKYNMHFINNLNNEIPSIEIFLMSQCKHNIIANSSFSWWGAWLNSNLNKIIICPHKWLSEFTLNRIKTKNSFTLDWIKL